MGSLPRPKRLRITTPIRLNNNNNNNNNNNTQLLSCHVSIDTVKTVGVESQARMLMSNTINVQHTLLYHAPDAVIHRIVVKLLTNYMSGFPKFSNDAGCQKSLMFFDRKVNV